MNKMNRLAALALIGLGAVSAHAEGDPTGVLSTFDVTSAGTAVKGIMITVLGIIGVVYGASMGFVFLRWVYRKVVGALGR